MGKCLLLKIKGVKCKQLNYTSSSPSIRAFLQLHSRHTEAQRKMQAHSELYSLFGVKPVMPWPIESDPEETVLKRVVISRGYPSCFQKPVFITVSGEPSHHSIPQINTPGLQVHSNQWTFQTAAVGTHLYSSPPHYCLSTWTTVTLQTSVLPQPQQVNLNHSSLLNPHTKYQGGALAPRKGRRGKGTAGSQSPASDSAPRPTCCWLDGEGQHPAICTQRPSFPVQTENLQHPTGLSNACSEEANCCLEVSSNGPQHRAICAAEPPAQHISVTFLLPPHLATGSPSGDIWPPLLQVLLPWAKRSRAAGASLPNMVSGHPVLTQPRPASTLVLPAPRSDLSPVSPKTCTETDKSTETYKETDKSTYKCPYLSAWQEAGLEVVASTVSALELLLQDLVDVAHSKDSSPRVHFTGSPARTESALQQCSKGNLGPGGDGDAASNCGIMLLTTGCSECLGKAECSGLAMPGGTSDASARQPCQQPEQSALLTRHGRSEIAAQSEYLQCSCSINSSVLSSGQQPGSVLSLILCLHGAVGGLRPSSIFGICSELSDLRAIHQCSIHLLGLQRGPLSKRNTARMCSAASPPGWGLLFCLHTASVPHAGTAECAPLPLPLAGAAPAGGSCSACTQHLCPTPAQSHKHPDCNSPRKTASAGLHSLEQCKPSLRPMDWRHLWGHRDAAGLEGAPACQSVHHGQPPLTAESLLKELNAIENVLLILLINKR
ncbi:hypothetical protein Anapl_13916 [Anas platyrhynchos]|uniref:Uncharacterized protein n=1 Tax=Anas platyrhynchos TaxID=8839 RepID=R0LQG0_ANAPL|nr:hypothetical protein Anapl_13916 [Anas platyrhynchos]